MHPRCDRAGDGSWCRRCLPPARQPLRARPSSSALSLELLGECDLLRAADIDRDTLVDAARDNFERAPPACSASIESGATSYIRRSLPMLLPPAFTSPG